VSTTPPHAAHADDVGTDTAGDVRPAAAINEQIAPTPSEHSGSALELVDSSILGCHVYCSPRVMGVVTTTTGGTAVLEKVFYTSVLVRDQDKALDFYTNVLGLEKRVENPTPDGPRFLTVGVKGDDFQLVLWPGTPGQAEPAMGRPLASITIETDDCRKTVEELKSRGVEFVSDVLEFPWGYVAQFQDPDGNRLQIREGR
jgi:predicted enzyme related to lactoylglutathione lyase